MADQKIDKGFDEALDASLRGMQADGWSVEECLSRYPAYARELAPILMTTRHVINVRGVSPDPKFRRQSWSRLQSRMRTARAPRSIFSVPRRAAVAFAAFTLVLAFATTTGTIYAASNALPGEPLYALEITVEQAQIRLAPPLKAMQLQLDFADRRVWEAERLAGRGDLALMAEPLSAYNLLVTDITLTISRGGASSDRAQLEAIKSTLADQHTRLVALQASLPVPHRASLASAIEAALAGQEVVEQALNIQ